MTSLELSDILFNCQTQQREPDWSEFKSLEIGGCIIDGDQTIGGQADDVAQFWTVYGRHHDGEAEAITDCRSRELARLVLARLRVMSGGLPVSS